MPKSISKLGLKRDPQSTEEIIMFVNTHVYKRWAEGDTSIPLVEVFDSFTVAIRSPGNPLSGTSKQQRQAVFGTLNDAEIGVIMLREGYPTV